jgi:hypothetical protein
MKWSWDEDHDDRVGKLWIAREELSRSGKVVYAKWYQNRATFFSRACFVRLLAFLDSRRFAEESLAPSSREVLDILLSDSPLSTKQLKAAAGLEGKMNETLFNRALRPLWQRLLLVGYGEFQDSSFPSLGHGATATLFEDLWTEAATHDADESGAWLREQWGEAHPFYRFALKIR